MHERRRAAAWTRFYHPTHMQQVRRGNVILMFAKGVGIIGVGRATAGYRVLAAGDAGRIDDGDYDEWQVPVVWRRWQPDAPCPWDQAINASFLDVSGDEYAARRQLVWDHFDL